MSSKHHRVARLLEMISLIRANKRLRPKDLAEFFNVSVKRIFDDIAELNAAGIPVVFQKEGYQILPSFFMPPTGFNMEETLFILLGLAMAENQGLVDRERRELISSKLLTATTLENKSLRDNIDIHSILDLLHVSPEWESTYQSVVFERVLEACLTRRILELDYETANNDQATTRQVAPYRLAYRQHAWYLLGHCYLRDRVRTFRLNRIRHITLTERTFKPEEDAALSFDDTWGAFGGEANSIHLHFDEEVAGYIKERRFPEADIIDDPGGGVHVHFKAANLDEVSWWTLQYAGHVTVIQPAELREKIDDRCREMLASNQYHEE